MALPAMAGAGPIDTPSRHSNVRTMDPYLAGIVQRGIDTSPTFGALVDRLNASDVVVYIVGDITTLRTGLDGKLTFLTAAAGLRYVVVRVNLALTPPRLTALLGHELQHAYEIAENADIVDEASLAREYRTRLGYLTWRSGRGKETFDTVAAVTTGERVLQELRAKSAAPAAPGLAASGPSEDVAR